MTSVCGSILLLLGTLVLGGCDSSGRSSRLPLPTGPTQAPPTATPTPPGPVPGATTLASFTDSTTGFSTTDLRDAQDQILQMNLGGELIWLQDGTRLPGYRRQTYTHSGGVWHYVDGAICAQGCSFEIRFGSKGGEQGAYLTVDYGHDNPGTLVDVEVSDGKLVVSQTTLYPPGTFTLSGVVTEMSPAGSVPVEGAYVARAAVGGWQSAKTDKDGFYAIPGLFNASREVESGKSGYVTLKRTVIVSGDTRLDITLTRNP